MPPKRVKKVMTLPINVIFGHLQVRRVASRSFVCACVVCCVYKMRAFVIFVQEEAANFFFGFDLCFYFFLMHLYTMPCMLHHTCCNYCGRTTTPPRPCIILMIEKIEGTYLVV